MKPLLVNPPLRCSGNGRRSGRVPMVLQRLLTNHAYRLSRGRHVMTLNPDTYLVPGCLGRKIKFVYSLLRIFLERFYADDLDF